MIAEKRKLFFSVLFLFLHILCFAVIPQAGALLADTRQPPPSASTINFDAAADAGTPTC